MFKENSAILQNIWPNIDNLANFYFVPPPHIYRARAYLLFYSMLGNRPNAKVGSGIIRNVPSPTPLSRKSEGNRGKSGKEAAESEQRRRRHLQPLHQEHA